MASNDFLKNFREATAQIAIPNIFGKTDFLKQTNLPNMDMERNSADYQSQVAVPFSYKTSNDGRRRYGIIYAPGDQSEKFFHDYNSMGEKIKDGDNINIYGAQLEDWMSLTGKGFADLFKKYKDSFRLERDLSYAAGQNADGTIQRFILPKPGNQYSQKNAYKPTNSMERLLRILKTANDKGGEA